MIRHVITGKRNQFWGDKGARLVLDVQGEIPKQLKHEPGLMLKCLAEEGNFTFVIPEVRVKFFKGCVCREAGQSTEDQASGGNRGLEYS